MEFTIATNQERTARQVYDEYCPENDEGENAFSKTHVPLSLAKYGSEQLISRSQAKRVLSRFTEFTEVLLDFKGIEFVGQGFADEIFRVFPREHPKTKLHVINTTDQVAALIRLAVRHRQEQEQLTMFDE